MEGDATVKQQIINMVLFTAFLWVIDNVLNKRIEKSRYYVLHLVANFFVVVCGGADAIDVLCDPIHSMDANKPYNSLPVSIIGAIHLYHMLFFNNLTAQDYFHHIVFVGVLIPGAWVARWGPLQNLVGFFLSGLPGGIDYALLSLVKNGYMARETEKNLNTHINVWLRAPGCVVSGFTMYAALLHGNPEPHWAAIIFVAVLVAFNGQYYLMRVVHNFGAVGGDLTC